MEEEGDGGTTKRTEKETAPLVFVIRPAEIRKLLSGAAPVYSTILSRRGRQDGLERRSVRSARFQVGRFADSLSR